MKKQIITIAGVPGSGKSSTADMVARELGFKRFSGGDFMRKVAIDRGMSLMELSILAEKDKDIDQDIDNEVRKMSNEEKIVIDSRLAFHWIPESFKVFLDLPLEISKDRILSNLRTNTLRQESEEMRNVEDVYQEITTRLDSEKKRYLNLYNIDYTDKKNFDLVVDTNKNNLREVASLIVSQYKNWKDVN